MKHIKSILYLAAGYISLVGLVTFSLFILEESIQMTTFGTWPASDAQDWHLVLKGCNVIETTNTTMKIINYSIGWIQPLAFFSYRSYGKATDYYIQALKSKIFAHNPETLIGHEVTLTISLHGASLRDSMYKLKNSNVFIALPEKPKSAIIRMTSIVNKIPQGILLKPDSILSVQ